MNKKNWIEQTARDVIALGSIVFYFLVVGRALVGPFWILLTFLSSAAALLLFIYFIHKDFDSYLARGIILAVGLSYFYGDFIFTLFASVIYVFMIISSYYLENSNIKIVKGIIFGLISTGAGYYTAELFFELPWY
jgi:hypothetical protein